MAARLAFGLRMCYASRVKVCTNLTCNRAGEPLDDSQFYGDASKSDGLSCRCRQCLDAQVVKRATENPRHHARIRWAATLKYQYGVTVEQYAHMLEDCGHSCEICRQPFSDSPNVDHDHATGAARGLLCGQCNRGLGNFADDQARLESAIRYLRKDTP